MGFENGHLLRVVLHAVNSNGVEHVNVLHYDLDNGSGTPNDPQALADRFRDDVMPAYAALYGSSWQIQPIVVEDEKDPLHPTDARSGWTSGTVLAGTRSLSGEGLPIGLCGINTWLTDHIGRRFRGRMFLGGDLREGDQAEGVWGTSITALWDALLAAIPRQPDIAEGVTSAVANQCVYSRTQRAANLDPYASRVVGNIRRARAHYLRSRER